MTRAKVPSVRVARLKRAVRQRLQSMEQQLVPPPAAILEMITGGMLAQAIHVAAKLGIADELASQARSAAELAQRVDASEDGLARLLRALAGKGLFRQRADGRFELTAVGQTLRSDSPVSMRSMALLFGLPEHREHWTHLSDAVRTGQPQIEAIRGMEAWAYFESNPAFGKVFNDAMTSMSNLGKAAIVSAYDFSHSGTIVDVGGGHGALLAAILSRNPSARGVLYDLPSVVEGAGAPLRAARVESRCSIEAGSFFDGVPEGGDTYILKGIIHSWSDGQVLKMLRNVRDVVKPDGRLLLIGIIVPEGNSAHMSKMFDLEMMLVVGGRERTEVEHRQLLTTAGFELVNVTQTASPMCIVEAKPV